MKTLYYNGTIITMEAHCPSAEALLVSDGKIEALGSLETLTPLLQDDTTYINLDGKTLLPGFIDGHSHVGSILAFLPKLFPPPIGHIDSKEALLDELRQLIANDEILENGWLVAEGYENSLFENESHPTREELDRVSTDIPILVLQSSGHVGVINSKALSLAGWNKHTPNPPGGIIARNPKTGEPTGFIEEKAIHALAFAHILKSLNPESLIKLFIKTQDYYASNGITTAQDGGTFKEFLPILTYCQKNSLLKLDIVSYIYQEYSPELLPNHSQQQRYDNHLKICGAKLVNDGSPQGKTAWLTQPYYKVPDGKPSNYCGYPIFSDEQVYQYCLEAIKTDCQMLVHCNGDATVDQFIHAYQQAIKALNKGTDLRPIIIHAQTLREDQLDIMKQLGILPSFFNDHVFYWGDYHLNSVFGPERGNKISPLKPTVNRHMPWTLHSDYPVTPPNILFSLHNAVNRKTRQGRDIGIEYAVDVLDALKAVTIHGAYQHFDETIKGSLAAGKLADLVILDKNPLITPKSQIKEIHVLETIKEGNTIYKSK